MGGEFTQKSKYYVRPDGLHKSIRTINGHRKAFRWGTDRIVDKKILDYKGEIEKEREFKAVAKEWWEEHEKTLATNFIKNYKPAYKKAVKRFDCTPIGQIKAPDIKASISNFARGGRAKKQY